MNWILLVSALVSCVAIGIVAVSDGEDLIARLKDDPLTIEQVSEMLQTCENPDAKIFEHTVEMLVDTVVFVNNETGRMRTLARVQTLLIFS